MNNSPLAGVASNIHQLQAAAAAAQAQVQLAQVGKLVGMIQVFEFNIVNIYSFCLELTILLSIICFILS